MRSSEGEVDRVRGGAALTIVIFYRHRAED